MLLSILAISASLAHTPVDTEVRVQGADSFSMAAEAVVDASLDDVAELLGDCEATAAWFPQIVHTERVGTACVGQSAMPWPLKARSWSLTSEVEASDAGLVRHFAYVDGSGNLDDVQGRWVLSTEGTQTRVRWEARIDLGLQVQSSIVGWGTRQVVDQVMPALEAELRRRDRMADAVAGL
ncbi:MAG: hypothetical protein EP330_16010 [Deltaproteobacteria bacterium]|nr:MAG: hypothetical protein EP330_16010 [Deltaproteobacteria bacterium]